MPKGNALTCTQCHTSTATQMNLKDMGYAMKGTQSTTCTQCHEKENIPSYTSLHKEHVTEKKYDCSWCHNFSRPERGLTMPSVVQTALLVNPSGRNVSKDAGAIVFTVSNTGGTMSWAAQVTSGSSWLRIYIRIERCEYYGSIGCEFDANGSAFERTATIQVKGTGATGSPTEVMVTQAGLAHQIGAGPGMTQVSLEADQVVELLINTTNGQGDSPTFEWFLLMATYGGNSTPLYLISDKGMYDVTTVLSDLYAYTYPFDKSGITHIAKLSMSELGLKPGDSLSYGYAYQNQTGIIVIDNIVIITVK